MSPGDAVSSGQSITLDQLVALNDEIAALTRAGIPLDQGLRALGQDLPGQLGRAASALGQRLHRGETLERAFEQMDHTFPPIYQAVVMVGLRSGRLPAALEGIATTSRRIAQLRRSMVISMVYPLIVLFVASVVLWFTCTQTQPVVFETYEVMDIVAPPWYELLYWVSGRISTILNVTWILVAVLFVLWFVRSGQASSLNRSVRRGLPTLSHLRWTGRMATFSELLALLVEQDVPLDEALKLAAAAGGDAHLKRTAQTLAERIQTGQTVGRIPQGFPPLLGWLLASGHGQTTLVKTLRQTADGYRRRFDHQATWLGVYLPIFLSAGIGGMVALYYVLLVMGPLYNLLYQLSLP